MSRPSHVPFRYAAQALALGAHQLLDDGRTEPGLDLRLDQALERDACGDEVVDHAHAANVSAGEASVPARAHDPQLDQLAQLVDIEAGATGRLRDLVPLHEPYCSGGAPGWPLPVKRR